MPDREKVIKAYEDYVNSYIPVTTYGDYVFEMHKAVLALLKEQEAVEPISPKDESDLWRCGNCNHQLFRCTHQRYCEMCGQAVKWE